MSKKGSTRIDTLSVKPSEAAIAIKHMIKVNLANAERGKKRRGLFIWGAPGIAKSSVVEQVADELNYKLIDIRLTQMEPTDLRGIPVPFKDETQNNKAYVEWAVPSMLPKREAGLDKDGKPIRTSKVTDDMGHEYDGAIILLDELPNAAPSVQAGSYQLVLDGALGEYIVPDNVVVMAAGNRETDKGATFKMPTPLQNRFTHIEMRVDFEDFQTFALTTSFHQAVVGYLTAFKHELFQFEATSASRGFPTPRSWEAVSDILRDDPNLPEAVTMALVAGAVGDGIAVKFLEYRKNAASLPASSDILDGKVTDLKKGADISLMYALTTALCYELKDRYDKSASKGAKPDEKKKFSSNVDNFLGFMMKNFQSEMVIMGSRTALAIFRIQFDPSGMKNWDEFSDKYQDLILQA
jgi:predicted AAA+ superfamily ATPase